MEVKSLFMRIGGGIACIVLFAMLFTACIDPATNNNDPYQNSYKPSVDTVGATYADVLFCTAEELQTLSSYEYFLYKESNTNSEYSSWNNDDNLSIKKSIYSDKFSEDPLIPNTNYNINLKAATITILAAVLDTSLTNGFASITLALSGFNSHAIVKLDEYKGEKCIILEI